MTTTLDAGVTRIVSTSAQRGRGYNPGERDFVTGLIAKANETGRRIADRCDSWPILGCVECAEAEPEFDEVGRRRVRPCGLCGGVRG